MAGVGVGTAAQDFGEFGGTSRFEIKRQVGRGAMGVVYEAHDRDRDRIVALKAMKAMDPAALYLFKQEFRSLADLSHPNLVSLYELMSQGDRWFFTMELVAGQSFLRYVRPEIDDASRSASSGFSSSSSSSPASGPDEGETMPTFPGEPERKSDGIPQLIADVMQPRAIGVLPTILNERRLRNALRQLAEGIQAIHSAGRLHRDIKPSNVLVTHAGRVVICDFGLVREMKTNESALRASKKVVGTVNFMSPEQAAGGELTAACDWYSVGVMLYMSLTGMLPFSGAPIAVLQRKQDMDPVRPSELMADVPKDLEQLCVELLRRDSRARPSGADILARLGASAQAAGREESTTATHFVGRRDLLEGLHAAYHDNRRGKVVLVKGLSGMGKSALVNQFFADLAGTEDALVLEGRCYERESVPYKAFDALVDGLANHLLTLAPAELTRILPGDLPALARLFPVIERLPQLRDYKSGWQEVPDPRELRRRAFGALRDLLRGLVARQPVVLYIDDLQWGDHDSGELLVELMRGREAPRVTLLASYRSEEEGRSPLLKELLGAEGKLRELEEVRAMEVGPLSHEDSVTLALSLGAGNAVVAERADGIAREAGGSPLFVRELVRYVESGASLEENVSLSHVLGWRVEQLSSEARILLSVVAVAGRPIEQRVAAYAASLTEGFPKALAVVRAEHLVRTSGVGDTDTIECYHDRVREHVGGQLPKIQLRQLHERLALALQWAASASGGNAGSADPEALLEHWLGADNPERAGSQAVVAARAAAEKLAFDRAVRLYRTALELGRFHAAEARQLRVELGDALANAGRGPEAADAYLAAVDGAQAAEALELRRRASERLLQSGHFDRALEVVGQVLEAIDEPYPATLPRAIARYLLRRARLRIRGLGFTERDSSQVSAEQLTRIDVLWSVATGVAIIDTIRGMSFQARHTLLALECGEPYRIARSLAMQATYSATGGEPAWERTKAYAGQAMELATGMKDLDRRPHAIGLATSCAGVCAFLSGRWKESRELCEAGEKILREQCTGAHWERNTSRLFMLAAMYYQGELAELSRVVPEWLRESEERGDLFGATGMRSWRTNVIWLMQDDPTEARRQLDIAHDGWSRAGFHLQHYYELLSRCQIDLFTGDTAASWQRVDQQWGPLEKAMLMRVQNVRIEAHHLRARCALARAVDGAGGAETSVLVAQARADAGRLAAEKIAWARALSELTLAGAAAAAGGDAQATAACLERAIASADAADMGLYANVARWRLADVTGDDGLRREVKAWMRKERVRNPARLVAMLAPGFR